MKKLFVLSVAVLVALAMGGCRRSGEPEQEVVFRLSGVRTGAIEVKSASDSLVNVVLGMREPNGTPELSLQSTSVASRRYTVAVGRAVSIPVGTYQVSGRYTPTQKLYSLQGNGVYEEPVYKVSSEVTVREGVDSYEVAAEYDCWALVVDGSDVSRVDYKAERAMSYATMDLPVVSEGVSVVYVDLQYSWDTYQPTCWKFFPVDEVDYETREYELVTKEPKDTQFQVRAGRWYMFGTRAVDRQEGEIGITMPGWQKGI